MVTITATDAGFHNLNGLGDPLAPNVFLRNSLNIDGMIEFDPLTGIWNSLDGLYYDGLNIQITGSSAPAADAYSVRNAQVTVTGITFTRIENGVETQIGSIDLGRGLQLDLQSRIEADGITWQADLADALEDQLQQEGYVFYGGKGADVFQPQYDILPIRGAVALYGRGGDDILKGGLSDDLIKGGKGADTLTDISGTNTLLGGRGSDVIELGQWSDNSVAKGGNGRDTLISSNGDDYLAGNRGADTLIGGRGADMLAGGRGNDRIQGDDGADILTGGRGSDILSGGADADEFRFNARTSGKDTITDFEDGLDLIFLNGLTDGFAALEISETETGVHLAWGGRNSIDLEGLTADQIDMDDFIFDF